nr:hypothetical protein [Mycobacterium pseudoshottsii]
MPRAGAGGVGHSPRPCASTVANTGFDPVGAQRAGRVLARIVARVSGVVYAA